MEVSKRIILSIIILLVGGLFFVRNAQADTLGSVSDTISTSRPSASAPLAANQAAAATQVTIFDNGSIFLASDSAVVRPDPGETMGTGVSIASMSASGIPSAGQRYVYFGASALSVAHHQWDPLVTPITAVHTIKFTTKKAIVTGGTLTITFPGAGSNIASPSASTFSFNGLAAAGVSFSASTQCPTGQITVNAPSITCTVTSGPLTAGTTVTVIVGSVPTLINPTKTLSAGNGDQWRITIATADNSGVPLDSGIAAIATNESVQVQGTVQPYITFTIAGVPNNTAACSDTTNPGAGKDSTAAFVDLGNLTSTQINISAQNLFISTNGGSYAITATSSGRFLNITSIPFGAVYIPDANGGALAANDAVNGTNPSPAALTTGTAAFGIHPCAAGASYIPTVPTGWGTGGGAGNKYSNPWNTAGNAFYAAISSYTTGPTSNSQTTIEYASTVAGTTPSGIYTTVLTYVATPTF